jgi:hypothetical protein
MGDESTLSARELAERQKARIREDAAAKTAAIDRDMAELDRITAKYGLVVSPAPAEGSAQAAPKENPQPQAQKAETGSSESITMDGLTAEYVKDKAYTDKRFRTRKYYDRLIFRIEQDLGTERIVDIDEARVLRAYQQWSAGGKLATGHSLVTMLRVLAGFGAKQLRRKDCRDLRFTLSNLKFPVSKPRFVRLTAEHATAIRAAAHKMGYPSIALAQALQFDCTLSQKDVIGEWVPHAEPGFSDIINGRKKWLRGIRWNEIDMVSMTLEHKASFDGKPMKINLADAPMVREELARLGNPPSSSRPVIVGKNGLPWDDDEYRRVWRSIADAAGVPEDIRNRHSRVLARDVRLNRRRAEEAG